MNFNNGDLQQQMRELSKLMGNNPYGVRNPFIIVKRLLKNFFNKNKKKIIIGLVITISIFTTLKIILTEKKGEFLITDNYGVEYNTNNYELKDGCVTFIRNKGKKTITICGNFKIETQILKQNK